MTIIGIIAFVIAYGLVGRLYNHHIIDGRGAGHVLHWIIRLFAFVIIFYLAATAIRIHSWFMKLPSYKWLIIGFIIGISVFVYGLYKFHLLKKKRFERTKE